MLRVPLASASAARPANTPAILEFVGLNRLACGCVCAAFRARLWDLALVSVEAKGPHCNKEEHGQGRVIEVIPCR
jgi:hypothetical protein